MTAERGFLITPTVTTVYSLLEDNAARKCSGDSRIGTQDASIVEMLAPKQFEVDFLAPQARRPPVALKT